MTLSTAPNISIHLFYSLSGPINAKTQWNQPYIDLTLVLKWPFEDNFKHLILKSSNLILSRSSLSIFILSTTGLSIQPKKLNWKILRLQDVYENV